MSTRSQIIVKDDRDEVWFYRHSDGYPSGNLPQLYKFLKWVEDGKIRENAEQSAGWLVLIGADEYSYRHEQVDEDVSVLEPHEGLWTSWKAGAYEPCAPSEHGDIEWLYTVNVQEKTIRILKVRTGEEKLFTFEELSEHADNDFADFEDIHFP